MHCTPNHPIAPSQPCPRAHTAKPQSPPLYRPRAITQPKLPHSLRVLSSRRNWCWPANEKVHHPQQRWDQSQPCGLNSNHSSLQRDWFPTRKTGVKRFPFNNFTHCLTLFSKFFSSFPHGTCSLSVSRRYLALDEIYHPFWAAFPNNSTLWRRIT